MSSQVLMIYIGDNDMTITIDDDNTSNRGKLPRLLPIVQHEHRI